MSIEDKLKALARLRWQKTEIKNQLDCTEALIEQAQAEIVDEFESRQIKSMKLDGIGNFVMRVSSSPRVNDPVLLRNWMEGKGIEWEVICALNAKKLQGFYNERLENGEELPSGVETYTKAIIALTKEA